MKAPLEPPVSGASLQQFELQRVDYSAPEAGGRIGGVQAGFPLWSAVWTIGVIGVARSDEWRAFLSALRGATRRFLGRDLARPYPKAYATSGFAGMTRAGGGTFDGSLTSWSETITADGDSQLTLGGLPAGFEFSPGDYVGFRWTATEDAVAGLTWHAPVRAVEAAVADEFGAVTITCEPPVPNVVPGGATAYLDKPAAVMVLISEKSGLDAVDRRLAVRGGTIAAVQELRA